MYFILCPRNNAICDPFQDYTLDMYYRRTWIDKRLSFWSSKYEELTLGNEMMNKIWLPGMFFNNAKHTKFNDVTTRNAVLRITKNGEIFLSLRLGQSDIHYII